MKKMAIFHGDVRAQQRVENLPSGKRLQFAIEAMAHRNSWFTYYEWWFPSSQTVNVYQRVCPLKTMVYLPRDMQSKMAMDISQL